MSGTVAHVPDMSPAPQRASGAKEQYCFSGQRRPAMPPHIFSCAAEAPPTFAISLLGLAAPPTAVPLPLGPLTSGGGKIAPFEGTGSCGGGVDFPQEGSTLEISTP